MIRPLFVMCLGFILTLTLVLSASAQTSSQGSSEPKADTTIPQTQSPEIESKPKATSDVPPDDGTAKSSGRVFRPTEEISEDSPVPFPVDI